MVNPEANGQARPGEGITVDSLPPRRGRWIGPALAGVGIAAALALLAVAAASGPRVESYPNGYQPREGETVIDANPPISQ